MGKLITIREVRNHVGDWVDLLGVVMEFSFPRMSHGTDYVSILKIVDQSQQKPELPVHVFVEAQHKLPIAQSYGDLILLRHVKVEMFDSEVYAVFKWKYSSYALFTGMETQNVFYYQTYSRFHLSPLDKNLVRDLRRWLVLNQLLDSGTSEYLVSLSDIKENVYFDLVCKVQYVAHDSRDDMWMLFVWDGADVPPLSIEGNLKDEEKNPLPLQIECSTLPNDILQKFKHVGTVLRVKADEVHENLGVYFRPVEKWIRIRNMVCQVSSGLWYGLLGPTSKVRLLSNNDGIVVDRIRFQEKARKGCRSSLWSFLYPNCLTEINYSDVQFVTLMDVLVYKEVSSDPLFCCVIRVIAICPSLVEDFYLPDRLDERRMRLTLEDSTARIHASLDDNEWEYFFGDCATADSLAMKIKQLLGVPRHQNINDDSTFLRHPPWIRCCISLESDNEGNQIYKLCDTKLLI
ncbi:protection of telomeres protein 1a-like isoform X2 [Tripterygium wilfordii]|uniref:protection of telomeres protein 1a-like isoform X2 n=1 Tax=Tripterygium wilfordii TaxID=458696 RepID=UPI0018F81011|nr:protection of telomeres protein 1a-like isoform X2 [Tripterygium wilfordii]